MDSREAKFVLSAYRPGGQDANDPRFSGALAQMRHDIALEQWFQNSITFDNGVTKKLHAIAVPRDLRDNILAGVKVSRPVRSPFIKWAIAAALFSIAILSSLIWRETRPAHLTGWQSHALDVISSLVRHKSKFSAQSRSGHELVAWLRANHAPVAHALPRELEKLEGLGCKTFSWNGIPISVICFVRTDGGLIHLVMMNASASDRALNRKPELVQQGHWATATWREGNLIYMLALEGSQDELRSYLL
jgi:hypothetical protein